MTLADCSINAITPGLAVISRSTSTLGKVVEVIKEEDNFKKDMHSRVRYDTIKIEWNNGKKSMVFHMQSDSIDVVQYNESC